MHECFTVQDWVRNRADPDSYHSLSTCSRCADAGSDLASRVAAVSECPGCRRALDAATPPDEYLGCPRCLETYEALLDMLEELEHFDPIVLAEAAASEAAFQTLVALEPKEQVAAVAAPEHRTWALCQRFVSEAQALWRHEPRLAASRAEVGVAIAEGLDDLEYHPGWVADLRAKAHGYLANCYRILARFPEADREIEIAHEHLRRGVGSGLWQARILSLEATLRMDQDRYDEAALLLDRIEVFYREHDDRGELARTHLKRSRIHGSRDQQREAARECERALAILDAEEHPALTTLAAQNQVYHLLHAGEVERARELFTELAPTDERMVLVRRKWIEAGLLRAEGKHAFAMQAYEQARKGFAAAELAYDVALVSLDQALTAYDMGDVDEMNRLAGAASLLLIEAGARREALVALQVLLSTIDRGTVNPGMFAAIHRRVAALRPS